MIVQIIIWVFLIVIISIIPLMVMTYWNKLKYKKTEITSLLSGKLGVKYLSAYYPETAEEIEQINIDDNLIADKLSNIIEGFFQNEYTIGKYMIPLITLILTTGIILFFFVASPFHILSLSQEELSVLQSIPALVYVGFLGAFISALIETYKRYNNMDLTPCFLYSINSKILLCSVLGYIWSITFTPSIAIVVSFGTGFFPLSALQKYIRKITARRLNEQMQSTYTSDLSKLQGLSAPIIDRLEEEDIRNCQTLAYCDPIKILLKTHYQLKIILDWIDQALLYIYAGDKIDGLRVIGIRGILELAILYEASPRNKRLLGPISDKIDTTPEVLRNFTDNVYNDPHIQFIWFLFSESSGDGD